jgi:hypothetical protein
MADAKKPKLGTGKRFDAVAGAAAQEYVKKGMSPQAARAIGDAIAARAGREAHGNKKMAAWAQKGKAKGK